MAPLTLSNVKPSLFDESCVVPTCDVHPFKLHTCSCGFLYCSTHLESRKYHSCHQIHNFTTARFEYNLKVRVLSSLHSP
jgi:hypothetical protein